MDAKITVSVITIVVGLTTFIINLLWAMSQQEKSSLIQSLQESAASQDKHVRLSAINYIMHLTTRKIFSLSFRTDNFQSCVNALLILWFYETDLAVRRFCELEWKKIASTLKDNDVDSIIDTIDCFIHDMNETYLHLAIIKQLPDLDLSDEIRANLESFDLKNIPEGIKLDMNPMHFKKRVLEMKVKLEKHDDEETTTSIIYQLLALQLHKRITLKRIMAPIVPKLQGKFPDSWILF